MTQFKLSSYLTALHWKSAFLLSVFLSICESLSHLFSLCLPSWGPQGYQQGSRAEAGGGDANYFPQTHRKHCSHLLCLFHHLWHSRSSGTWKHLQKSTFPLAEWKFARVAPIAVFWPLIDLCKSLTCWLSWQQWGDKFWPMDKYSFKYWPMVELPKFRKSEPRIIILLVDCVK